MQAISNYDWPTDTLRAGASDFLRRVESRSGERVRLCYQCEKCATGCPLVTEMDYPPHQILRLVQLGDRSVLASRAIWLCVGCYTCSVRCPNGIDVAAVTDALRELACAEGIEPAIPEAHGFHRLFLSEIHRRGRISELLLMARYGLRSGNIQSLLERLPLGQAMLAKGRLEMRIPRVKGWRRTRARLEAQEHGKETHKR